MADEPLVIRGINWRETFPFTNIFRAFRVAIHPSKLILALLALVCLYIGGRVMDMVWSARSSAVPEEIALYEAWSSTDHAMRLDGPPAPGADYAAAAGKESFSDARLAVREGIEARYAEKLVNEKVPNGDAPIDADTAKEWAKSGKYSGTLKSEVKDDLQFQYDKVEDYHDRLAPAAKDGSIKGVAAALEAYYGKIEGNRNAVKAAERAKYNDAAARTKAVDDAKKKQTDDEKAAKEQLDKDVATAKDNAKKARDELEKKTDDAGKKALAEDDKRRTDDLKKVEDKYTASRKGMYAEAEADIESIDQINGKPLFRTLFDYQAARVNDVVKGVLANDWLTETAGKPAVVPSLQRFFTVAPLWAIRAHTIYFTLFTLLLLAVWAYFGGAVARIAAVHVAREEKISARAALKFSASKFLSFLAAPLIPIIIVILVGLLVSVVGLIGNIPFIGPIIIGILFFLALMAGFVMTLVLMGMVGGMNLMYPTIAVEGSDSFDAMARSFSYVFARPWRMIFYTIVAIIYGSLTYLFVRVFIFLTLKLTHFFAGWLIFTHARNAQYTFDMMWPEPTSLWHFPFDTHFLALGLGPTIGGFFVTLWVYILIAMMGAFLISFFLSANTIIYFLMRREVDATELDEVYLDQPEDEFGDAAPAAAPAAPGPMGSAGMPAGAPAVIPAAVPPAQPEPTPPSTSAPMNPEPTAPVPPPEPPPAAT